MDHENNMYMSKEGRRERKMTKSLCDNFIFPITRIRILFFRFTDRLFHQISVPSHPRTLSTQNNKQKHPKEQSNSSKLLILVISSILTFSRWSSSLLNLIQASSSSWVIKCCYSQSFHKPVSNLVSHWQEDENQNRKCSEQGVPVKLKLGNFQIWCRRSRILAMTLNDQRCPVRQ